jgi:hypothetical protein
MKLIAGRKSQIAAFLNLKCSNLRFTTCNSSYVLLCFLCLLWLISPVKLANNLPPFGVGETELEH